MGGHLAPLIVGAAAACAGVGLARVFDVKLHRLVALGVILAVAICLALSVTPPIDAVRLAWIAIAVTGWTALAITDAFRHEIPDLVSLPFLVLGILYQAFLGLPIVPSLIAIGLLFGLAFLTGLTNVKWRHGIGGGDVVLLGIALAWLGPFAIIDVLLLASFLLIPQIAHFVVTGSEDRLPLAPAFGIATLIVWIGGPLF